MNNNDEEQTTTSFIDQPKSNDKIIHILETKKKSIPGIIYLSRIPNKMNVTIIRSYFDQYAPTGRIYLQLSSEKFIVHILFLIFLYSKKMKLKLNENVDQNIQKVGLNLNRNVMLNL